MSEVEKSNSGLLDGPVGVVRQDTLWVVSTSAARGSLETAADGLRALNFKTLFHPSIDCEERQWTGRYQWPLDC